MLADHTTADEADRQIIRTRTASTLFVEAGAGSGKTHELVRRVVALVAGGASLRAIAAITFTNAAAAELRDRVRLELGLAARGAESYETLSPDERSHCADALGEIDSAAIQTLHSFAQRILSLYPVEAGLPPEIAVREAVAASIAFEERWQPFLEDLLRDGGGNPEVATALLRAFTLGLTERHLRAIALSFHEDWDRVLPVTFEHAPMPPVDLGEIVSLLLEANEPGASIKPGRETDDAYIALERLRPGFASLIETHEALETAHDTSDRLAAEEHALRLLMYGGKLNIPGNRGQKGNWEGTSLASLRSLTKHAEDHRDALLKTMRPAALGPLLSSIQGFVRDYRDERITAGVLEFHDLLVLTRDLLVRDAGVRRGLANRYATLLIDEFQDTDPIQVEIATLIAASLAADAYAPWRQLAVEPGRLFFVGDPKQSIYRFRRADIDLYTAAAAHFGQPPVGTSVHLTQNFRSVPSVIDWVNHTFATLFALPRKQPGGGPVAQVPFEPLVAFRPAEGPHPSVHLLGGGLPKEESNTEGMRVEEAKAIAAAIAGIRAEPGRWQVGEGESRRPAHFADIAVLLPTRTAQPQLEEALNEAAIPYRVESSSLIFETQEVRDLLTILAAIEDPSDQVAVVAALRTPGFGCSDRDLFDFHRAGGRWDYRAAPPEAYPEPGVVADSMRSLAGLHARRWWLDPAAMIDLVVRERRLFQVAFARRRPRESWQRLRLIHEQARAFSAAGGRGLRQFIQFVERQAAERARMTESVVPEDDDDAVRVLTVHASKGLEFPIVILAGLNAKPTSESPVLLWDTEGGAQVRVGSSGSYFETPGYPALKDREDSMERLEGDRLLYVAATRSRDHLIVSVYHTLDKNMTLHDVLHADNKCCPAECILAVSELAPDLWRRLEPMAVPTSRAPAVPAPLEDTAADRDAWVESRRALIAANARMPLLAATAIAKAAAGSFQAIPEEKPEQAEDDAPWKRGRAGTSVGRAVHAVLQTVDLATGEGLEAAARAQAVAEGVEGRERDIIRYARAALESGAVRAAVASGRYWREVYVSANVAGATIEGFIDLLYETPAGLVVVDYKTDTVVDEAAIEAAMARYRLQGATYALALQESLGRPLAGCTFVFVQPRQERDIADLQSAMQAVRQLIPAALAS